MAEPLGLGAPGVGVRRALACRRPRRVAGVAARVSATISLVAQPSTADVSRSRPEADEAAQTAIALAMVGGERGPTLDRTRPPWSDLLGEAEAVGAVEAVPA